MPWLPIYCTQADLSALFLILSDDIAFIVADGEGRWRAVSEWTPPTESTTALWHVPSGPLPLLRNATDRPDGQICDPWSGWNEEREGADRDKPYFGPGHPGVFWLNLRVQGVEAGSVCGLSSIEWIGNHYSVIGYQASESTSKRWSKLRRQVAKVASKVPCGGLVQDRPPEVWAFPFAREKLGKADANPV